MFTYTTKKTFMNEEKELAKDLIKMALNSSEISAGNVLEIPDVRRRLIIGCMDTAKAFMDIWEERNPTKEKTDTTTVIEPCELCGKMECDGHIGEGFQ